MKKMMNLKTLKIFISGLFALAGLLTIIFAIISLASNNATDTTKPLRIILGIILILTALPLLISGITAPAKPIMIRKVIIASLILGTAVFAFLNASAAALNTLVGYLFPILIAAFGLGLIMISFVKISREVFNKTHIFVLLAGIAFLVFGICFTIFAKKVFNVTWLFIGLSLLVCSVGNIILMIKGKSTIFVWVEPNVIDEKKEK